MQALARAAVDSTAAKRINAILQHAIAEIVVVLFAREYRVTNSHRAELDDIQRLGGAELLKSYEDDAALVMRMRDPQRHGEAVYYAANASTPGGIGSLAHHERLVVLEQFEVGFRAYRDAQANRAHPDVLARLGRLLEADQAVAAEPVATFAKGELH